MYPQLQQLADLLVSQTPEGPPPGGCAGGPEQIPLLLMMLGIIYFVWLRPASKEQKNRAEMLKNLKRGDRVVTTSGMIGTVADKSDDTLTIEVAKNVKIEMLKTAVAKRVKTPAEAAAASSKKDAEPAKKKS